MKLHHTEYKKNYKNYILNTIEEDGEGKPLKTDQEKIKYLFDRFNSEYGWHINQVGKYQAMTNWLAGMALNIECYYSDIIPLAIKMGSLEENASQKLKDKVCDKYFPFMANVILSFEPKEKEA